MEGILSYLNSHGVLALVVYWFAMAALDAMPLPDETSGKLHTWFYSFSKTFSANVVSLVKSKMPIAPKEVATRTIQPLQGGSDAKKD